MQLHYQTYGAGLPLIILHGLFGMLDNWHTVSKMLAEHFLVVAVDQRNHGRSPHAPELDYDVMAEDTREFIAQRDFRSCFMLGHSMGGKVAMATALKYPQLIDRLVVVDIAPRSYPSYHDVILEALASTKLHDVSSRQEIDVDLSSRIPDISVRQFLMKDLARNEDGSFRWKMNLPVIAAHYQDVMKGIDTTASFAKPTLFIRSTKSSYITNDDLPIIIKLFPHSSITDFETGHWVHAEAPGQLSKTVTEFLLR